MKLNKKELTDLIKSSIDIVKDIDEKFQASAFQSILDHFLRNLTIEKGDYPKEEKLDKKPLSLTEIIAVLKPKKYTDSALLISYYIYKFEEINTFNIDSVKEKFDKLRIPKPKNMTDTLNGLIKRGFLRNVRDIDNKKGYEITNMGLQYIDDILQSL